VVGARVECLGYFRINPKPGDIPADSTLPPPPQLSQINKTEERELNLHSAPSVMFGKSGEVVSFLPRLDTISPLFGKGSWREQWTGSKPEHK